MNSQNLQAELSHLIQESKRKHSDLRNAAEQSLSELKNLPSTSEAQLAADLFRRPHFAKPFVLACTTRQARLAAIGVGCIQKLVTGGALPPDRLQDVIEGLYETTSLSLEVQLKVLQTLPALFQHYSDILSGSLLASTLEICATLQNSKTTAVSSTAAATLQQLIVSVFERVAREDEAESDIPMLKTVSVENEQINVSASAYDALRIFEDLCSLVEGEKPRFLNIKALSKVFILELIESVLASHHGVFARHPEQADILRRRFMPLAVRYLSERHNFSITVRTARTMLLIFKSHLSLLPAECDMALSLLIHLLETDTSTPWKRVLCLEVFRSLYAEPGLVRQMYSLFDEQPGRRNILRDHMACLARIASEKPSLIGVSHQSSVPTKPDASKEALEDQVAFEAVGMSGVIGGTGATDTTVCGISSEWSLLRIPYLETLDKLDNPSPPETYIYTLVLNCISAFSEGIARFVLPLTASESKSKRRRRKSSTTDQQDPNVGSKTSSVPLNPLDLESHPQIGEIRVVASMIDACWPAVLASCSTFFYAALDGDFYHNLVRAFQKLAHVAGLLRLSTPRDALLTTLGKCSIPSDMSSVSSTGAVSPGLEVRPKYSAEAQVPRSPSITESIHSTADSQSHSLSARNLLCLRALLNLAIALGPTLDRLSWSIILDTLQHAELILNIFTGSAPKLATSQQSGEKSSDIGTEILAVQSATIKMFESTGEYPDNAFEILLVALLGLSEYTEKALTGHLTTASPLSPAQAQTSRPSGNVHQGRHSISLARGKAKVQDDELKFVLDKINDLTKANIKRLAMSSAQGSIWTILVSSLVEISQNGHITASLRLQAANVLDKVVFNTIKLRGLADESVRNQIQVRGLSALQSQILSLYNRDRVSSASIRSADVEIHDSALETLKSVLEECGESLTTGWDLVFELISTVFDTSQPGTIDESNWEETQRSIHPRSITVRTPKLVRTAYDSLQLVASDFLSLLPPPCLLEMISSFSNFAAQAEDFNISLTTTTHFWNISDFLRKRMDSWSIGSQIDVSSTEQDLTPIAKDTDSSASSNALWLLLLSRIVDLTLDHRSEIRNGAVQTLLRIMDQYGDQLPPDAWNLCLNRILFVMAEGIQQRALEATKSETCSDSSEHKYWVDTTMIVTKGLSSLISNYFSSIIQHKDFVQSWARFLRYFKGLVTLEVLDMRETTFASFAEVLSRVRTYEDIGLDSLKSAWRVWVDSPSIGVTQSSNQGALLAYIHAFQQLYRLLGDTLGEEEVVQVLEKFKRFIWESVISRYSPDLERESELQSLIVQCLKSLCLEKTSSQPAIIDCLAEFSDAPLTKWFPEYEKDRPTFVAFSKSIMRLLSWYLAEHGIKTDILTNGALVRVLNHLANPMLSKYAWQGKDYAPALWQVASTSSLQLLQVAIPYVEERYATAEQSTVAHFWSCVVTISRGILSVIDKDSDVQNANLFADEAFDITAFQRLRSMIIPSLGSSHVPEEIRREFACTIFFSSLIYPPQRLDLPEGYRTEPLRNLYRIRMGRTYDLMPTPRLSLSYVLIDTLFDLVSAKDGINGDKINPPSSANGTNSNKAELPYTRLAKSISPFLILRCAISLKAYIADQPLRGVMPQPMVARKELLYLLKRLVELRSEPAAIPPARPGVPLDDDDEAKYKKHLGWMYPLVVRAIKVAGKETEDSSVLDALTEILESLTEGETEGSDED
ncbi:hypothetical protein VTO42DRAFT_4217 [Malbranchea cinnamomea]